MAPRAIWSGVVSFGMVSIPVKLHSATHAKDISFNLIHTACGGRIQQKRWCPVEDVEVPWEEVARGYQYAKGHYVVLTDEDFASLPLPSKHTIELAAFVQEAEIDPVFYEKSYYLAPEAKGEKPYALLLRVLAERRLVAIARITIRKKEQLCAIRPQENVLLLETLFYPDEVARDRDVDLSGVKLSERELEMASTLIDLLRRPFAPEEYRDQYREALSELIDAKLEGREVVAAPAPREAKVINLADALARSVAEVRKARPASASGKRRRAAPARRRTRKAPERKTG